jgi:hypothetical protein
MDIDVFPHEQLETVFRVLRTALNPSGPLEPRERAFLHGYARVTGYALPSSDPQRIRALDVHLVDAHQRKRLLQLSSLATLLAIPVRADSVRFLHALARRLETHDQVLDVISAMHQNRRWKVRLLTMRRAFGAISREAYQAEGVWGVVRFFSALLLKRAVNRKQHWNYKRLGLLPEGSLGREFWKHQTALGFGFPGEPGGIADSIVYHDIGHVLTGHNTSPADEIQQGSFQGGNRRDDGFFFVQFVVLQFHHGVRITPAARPEIGLFDPEKVLWAIHRGAQFQVDITHQWNFWPLMRLPVTEVRNRYGLLPA